MLHTLLLSELGCIVAVSTPAGFLGQIVPDFKKGFRLIRDPSPFPWFVALPRVPR